MKSNMLAVLYGGPSSERAVSFSTKDFFTQLYHEYKPLPLEWNEDFTFSVNNESLPENQTLDFLRDNGFSVVLASHGEYVEDGYIQERFEHSGINFTGSNSVACRLAMDKYGAQDVVEDITTTIPTYKSKPSEFDWIEFSRKIGNYYPVFLKPNNLGSSVGAYIANDRAELEEILENLTDIPYLFQPLVDGLELSLGTVREGDGYMNLFPTEIRPKSAFFDYDSKYVQGMSEEITPAKIPFELIEKIRHEANSVHEALGLGYYSRSDFILTPYGELYYLETNPLPGMTHTSLVPQQLLYSNKVDAFKTGLLENLL